jgi:phage protein D
MSMTTAPVALQSPTIKVDGANVAAAQVAAIVELRVERTIGVAARFEVSFRDPEFALHATYDAKIGSTLEIGVRTGSVDKVLLKGEITEVTLEGSEMEQITTVVGYDRSHRLTRAARVEVYLNQNYSGIVSTIAQRNGLTAQVSGLPSATYPHVTQACTDLVMLERIALATAAEWYVDDTTLVVRKRPDSGTPAVTLRYGEDVLRAVVRRSVADEQNGVTVRGWSSTNKQAIVGTATSSGGPRPSSFAGAARTAAYVVQSQEEATSLANAIRDRIRSSHRSVRVEIDHCEAAIRPGSWVGLQGLGTVASGTHYVTAVEHVIRAGRPFQTRITCGGLDDTSLVELLNGTGAASAASPLGTGVTIGIVTNNEDPEGAFRVRLKIPALDDQKETEWARVVVPDGGPGRGWRFVPEVNDEVLVAFEHGDLRRPYVIGGLWNGRDAPPTVAALESGKVPERAIRSRLGHQLTMRDGTSDDKKNVEIKLADAVTTFKLGQDKVQLISNDKAIEIKHNRAQIVLTDSGDITLKGMNITIDAQQDLKISALNVTTKAKVKSATEAVVVEVKGSGTTTIESTGMTQVKGAAVKIN